MERRREEQLSLEAPEAGANTLMADDYVDYGDLEAVKLQKATQPNERRRNGVMAMLIAVSMVQPFQHKTTTISA